MKDEFDNLQKEILRRFELIIGVRSSHVHSSRYSDEDLDLFSSLVLIDNFKQFYKEEEFDKFPLDLHTEYKRIRKDWQSRIKKNNKSSAEFLDYYCDLIYPYVTSKGRPFLPAIEKQNPHQKKGRQRT